MENPYGEKRLQVREAASKVKVWKAHEHPTKVRSAGRERMLYTVLDELHYS